MAPYIKITNGSISMEIPPQELDLYKRAGYWLQGEKPELESQPEPKPEAPVEETEPEAPATPEELNTEAIETVNKPKGTSKAKK